MELEPKVSNFVTELLKAKKATRKQLPNDENLNGDSFNYDYFNLGIGVLMIFSK